MTRRCSHCCNNGHNSRTCPNNKGGGGGGGVKLFGVRLTDGSIIKKSASMGNLSSAAHYFSSSSTNASSSSPNNHSSSSPSSDPLRDPVPVAQGYVSDDPAQASCSSNCRVDRKKGVPWTEEEHRLFLMGLHKLGKGDWRGIARNFVMSRTPTQVASHAQKYFNRQTNANRRKRRSSLFDMVPDMSFDPPSVPEEPEELFMLQSSHPDETEHENPLTSLHLSFDPEPQPMETTSVETPTETVTQHNYLPVIPAFFPAYLPVPYPFWPLSLSPTEEEEVQVISHHQVLKPTPIHSKNPINVDELVGMSMLTLGDAGTLGRTERPPLSVKLIGAPSRQSAFHPNPPVNGSNLSKNSTNAIHAV